MTEADRLPKARLVLAYSAKRRPAMIRATYEQRGEFSAAVELRQLFPGTMCRRGSACGQSELAAAAHAIMPPRIDARCRLLTAWIVASCTIGALPSPQRLRLVAASSSQSADCRSCAATSGVRPTVAPNGDQCRELRQLLTGMDAGETRTHGGELTQSPGFIEQVLCPSHRN
jgi:hypothetical protein